MMGNRKDHIRVRKQRQRKTKSDITPPPLRITSKREVGALEASRYLETGQVASRAVRVPGSGDSGGHGGSGDSGDHGGSRDSGGHGGSWSSGGHGGSWSSGGHGGSWSSGGHGGAGSLGGHGGAGSLGGHGGSEIFFIGETLHLWGTLWRRGR